MKNVWSWIGALCLAALIGVSSVALPASAQEAEEASAGETQTAQIDLNHASETELTALPGVGPSRARAIVAYRERRPFRRVEEVMRVRGIGRATFRQMRAMLTVSPPAE